MRVLILAVGAPRNRALAAAIREYETRAGRYFSLEAIEVPAARTGRAAPPELVRRKEAEDLRQRLPADLRSIALTREGRPFTSRDLAGRLSDLATYGGAGIAFLIGGAHGLDAALREACERRLSLSALTLPHDLARLVLAEQLYRAGTILRGEPYHKGR
ncbi:MAG: 23S rRNA (pseudouridine(1915)-N(3))-methyltransferase RlmH [Gemmatimonadota bacterium]|nr:23S rRNA (pseudouridine(1915)-N(3))-methyltransferase RlmH [Gemmatimonadota bacterium]